MSLLAIIIGCVTGFVAAFFGIGGSSIDTPLLRTFLHLSPYEALGTPLPLTILTASIAFVAYRREGLVNGRLARLSLLTGLPGMIAGSVLTFWISGRFLMLLTAVVLFLIGVDFIAKDLTEKTFAIATRAIRPPAWRVLIVSGAIGILSGMLANGGGIFFVPAFVILFRLRIKEAVATSLLVVAVMAIPGSLVHIWLGHVNLPVMAALGIGIIPMAYLGARTDIRTQSKTVMLLYGLLVSGFAIFFFLSQLNFI